MRFKLHPDWKKILKHAWSVRLDVLLLILESAQAGIDVLSGNPPLDPKKFAVIAVCVTATTLTARFIKQRSVSGDDH